QAAFATSDRCVRGRIVELLREGDGKTLRDLTARIGDTRVPELARILADEGLLEIKRGRARLPGS
ncbi:MAG TPA: A/G-specific adenine glycosylase, partial [Candidatus Limnocylindria bacterium]